MTNVHFYFRHPGNIYFSIEKLFSQVAAKINNQTPQKFSVSSQDLPLPTGLSNLWDNISHVRNTQTAINHITGDVHYAILGCNKSNINILTVHDCVMLRRLSKSNPKYWIIKWFWYDWPVRKADMVTVISENTKQELIHFTGCAADRIRVIGNFYDERFVSIPHFFNKTEPVVLFIGTAPNKNLRTLINAIGGLSIKLHIVGTPSPADFQELQKINIAFQVSTELSDEEMRRAYIECDILAFPSVYEGFGLPIIEAQLTGRPVLTSNLSPMKEVAADAALLVDPYDTASIRAGLLKIIGDDLYRESIVNAGFENVKRFNAEAVSKQYTELYEELLTEKSISKN